MLLTAIGLKDSCGKFSEKNKYLLTKDLSAPHAFMLIYISREEASYQKLETCFTALSGKFRKKLEGHEEKSS